MNQQASDLPWPVQMIGRYRSLIGLVALLGALAGIVFAALEPAGVSPARRWSCLRRRRARPGPSAAGPCSRPAYHPGQVARGHFRAESR